jgi:uncharacterized tellurite resistance protein B-like protein
MKTITITFQISEETLLDALKEAGSSFNLTLKEDFDLDEFGKELNSDISNYFDFELAKFLEEGVNQDLYLDYFEDEDED